MRKNLNTSERRYLDRARVCRVGSIGANGRPHVAPLCHAVVGRTLYVATERNGRTARNLRKKSRATIVCDDYSEDWGDLRGIEVHARSKSVDRGTELAKAQRALTHKFRQYRTTELDFVLAFKIEGARSWGL